jgi:Skp family chaperone for outer membrane proteins
MPQTRGSTIINAQDAAEHFADALTLLRSVRRTLSDLLTRVEDGETGLLKEVGLKQAELESALKRAFEAEEKYNAWAEKQGARTALPAGHLDLDAVRHDIACRLARLRECCQEG